MFGYDIGNFEYLLEWLALNCSPEVGDAVVSFVRALAMTPHAWPPEGRAVVGAHPQTRVTFARVERKTLLGVITRPVVKIEYLVVDGKTRPPLAFERPRIEILHLQSV